LREIGELDKTEEIVSKQVCRDLIEPCRDWTYTGPWVSGKGDQ